jgi:predicted type IV restriction endonuclease/KaiC/GvpD/RAD55 family RecA-like ATPase
MSSVNADQGFECFKKLIVTFRNLALSESDTRAKIIDPTFKCLGWDELDIRREENAKTGFIDYVFRRGNVPLFVLEAKKVGNAFIIPAGLPKRRYKISGGSISTDNKIRDAIDQAQKYSISAGTPYAVITNGHQYILFESFKYGGNWKDGFCLLFRSFEDIVDNFTLFWNVLSKEGVASGSLKSFISEETVPLDFKRPQDFLHNEDASCDKNGLALSLTPIIKHVFKDLTEDSQLEILKKCYVRQKQLTDTDSIIKTSFDELPYYAEKFDINWFKESESGSGEFQLSFEKCAEFLRKEIPMGSIIVLLGGVGSGKTTFVHHFFKIVMADRGDILWFYINFGISPPDIDKIEGFIYESIVKDYQKRYKNKLEEYLNSVGLKSVEAKRDSLIAFFTMLRYKRYTVSVVLDNVDQHSYTSPKYQERVFESAQSITYDFKTVTLLTLREASFFRSTRSGVLDAYHIPKFHVESPNFEALMRNRINYTLEFLEKDEEEIIKTIGGAFKNKEILKLFFLIICDSIRQTRKAGGDILRFINDVSGGDKRQALRFINAFMTSGNTDIAEMMAVEASIEQNQSGRHYLIPLHHFVKSIMLEDSMHFSSSRSSFINLFYVNPQYTNSHFIHLRILHYLNKRTNYFVALDKGFVDINQIREDAEAVGTSVRAVEDSLKKLAEHGLVEFDNQNKLGYEDAVYVRITTTGKYYFEHLAKLFAYIDLVYADTPICDPEALSQLRKRMFVDPNLEKQQRMQIRFDRTEIFLKYLKDREAAEFAENPEYEFSEFTKARFMEEIIRTYSNEIDYIIGKL